LSFGGERDGPSGHEGRCEEFCQRHATELSQSASPNVSASLPTLMYVALHFVALDAKGRGKPRLFPHSPGIR
jgi:hypothetical protein